MGESTKKRILVTWGSKLGGTEGIARMIGEVLERDGCEVVLERAALVGDPSTYDAVIVGGALYANRWHRDARRFVARNVAALRRVPVWLFSSGPLDDSADRSDLAPTTQVGVLVERVGALGHVTFGGRLAADVKGFPAAAMAKTLSGDWRNPERVRAWASEVARALPTARPGPASDPPARSAGRLLAYGCFGWMLGAAAGIGLEQVTTAGVTMAVRAALLPLLFLAISVRYFRARGAREPLSTALTWTVLVAALDAVGGVVLGGGARFTSIVGTWLPYSLLLSTTWATGALMSTMPWTDPKAKREHGRDPQGGHGVHAAPSRP